MGMIESDMRMTPFDNRIFNSGIYLLPIGFDDLNDGLEKIKMLKKMNNLTDDPDTLIRDALNSEDNAAKFSLSVLGTSREALSLELDRAEETIGKSLESGKDWQTPAGSFFTPDPLGSSEKIAFVYPGAFGTYIGMGNELFTLFPHLREEMQILTDDPGRAINEDVLFPHTEDTGEIAALQAELDNSPTTMISSGICFSYLFTVILRDIFGVNPDATFGYSLGENSMMFATGVWTQADGMRTSLETSPIFHERVSGSQKAIREYWGISNDGDGNSVWANYVLMAPYDKVKDAIKPGDRVYITHINTPRQVVIGGDDDTCRKITDEIKCMYLKAPYNHAIHCPPVQSEIDAFTRLHFWPVEKKPEIPIYSAADYAPLELESRVIAQSFAKMLTHPIDFPRLVNRAYDDGARIFIELGAGSNCSKWVDAILKDKRHVSMTINQNNVSDHISILKLLAKMISHRIPLNHDVLCAN